MEFEFFKKRCIEYQSEIMLDRTEQFFDNTLN